MKKRILCAVFIITLLTATMISAVSAVGITADANASTARGVLSPTVLNGYGRNALFDFTPLSIDGGTDNNEFVFYAGKQSPGYTFYVNPAPENITDFIWNAEGLPDGLMLTENTPDCSIMITGAPTTVSGISGVTIKVSATDSTGKNYYGELTVKAVVEIPYADIKTIAENAACTVSQDTANTEAEVLDWLNNTWLPGLLEGKRIHERDVYAVRADTGASSPFTAAVGGTALNPDGTDGLLLFELCMVYKTDNGTIFEALAYKAATVKASAYSHTHLFGADWISDAEGHRHICSCGEKADSAAHTPGAEATETQPQKCVVCGYIMAPATGHIKHTLTFIPEVKASCTADGNTAYYTCSGCGSLFSDADGTCVIPDKSSVCIVKTRHIPNNKWTKDETAHWYVCTVCKAKCSEEAHQYFGLSVKICNVCGYCSSLSFTLPDITFGEEIYKNAGIRFSPDDSTAIPSGASLSVQTYTPTAEDISAAVTEGFSQKADVSEIKKYTVRKDYISISKSFTHKSQEYNIGDIIIDRYSKEYLVRFFSADRDFMYCTSFKLNGFVDTVRVSLKSYGQIPPQLKEFFPESLVKLQSPYRIQINGVLYTVKFEEEKTLDNIRNLYLYIYTTDGASAGKVTVQKNSKGEDFIASAEFNENCDPESLPKLYTNSIAPDGSFTADGEDYLIYTVFSQDISVNAQSGEKLNLPGNMEFTGFPAVKDAVSYLVMHSGGGLTKNQIEKATYSVNSDCTISLAVGHESPFMIFAIVEDTVAETPVKALEYTDSDGVVTVLWIVLPFIFGTAVLTIFIYRKRYVLSKKNRTSDENAEN